MATTRYPELDLDLTFHPVQCARASALTPEQITQYNEEGYVNPITLFAREQHEGILRRFQQTDPASTKPLNPHSRLGWVYDLVANPQLLGYMQDILGSNVICFISQYIDKLPGSGTLVPVHQDAAYFAVDARATVKAWLALEDADTSNGCMWICPGSHKLGALEVRDQNRDLNLVDAVREDVVRGFGKTPLEVKAGQVVFFSTLLVHLSPGNPSDSRHRRALTMAYGRAESRPHTHPKAKHAPVLCSGRDIQGNWPLLPCPVIDLLSDQLSWRADRQFKSSWACVCSPGK